MEWNNKDLYNEEEVPMVFDEGYFKIELKDFMKIKPLNIFELNESNITKMNMTIDIFHARYDNPLIYYKFIDSKTVTFLLCSEKSGEIIASHGKFRIDDFKRDMEIRRIKNFAICCNKTKEEKCSKFYDGEDKCTACYLSPYITYELSDIFKTNGDYSAIESIVHGFNLKWANVCVALWMSALWYLASIQNVKRDGEQSYASTKEIKMQKRKDRKRTKVRNMTAPIYDFGEMKIANVGKLMAKKRGWKISYEFQVRGHYRHYKSGKVVFIKAFEKGKGLKKKKTIIKLNPNE
jgi:hypothetical protein